MKNLSKFTAIALLASGLSACVINVGDDKWEGENDYNKVRKVQEFNQNYISQLAIGTSINSVRQSMGTPAFTEAFNKQGQHVEVLFYRTQRVHGDGETTKDECTALVFREGQLSGWGDKAYQNL